MAGSYLMQVEIRKSSDIRKITDLPESTQKRVCLYTAVDLWGNLGREAPRDQGRLAGSFSRPSNTPAMRFTIRSSVPYSVAVNQGSRPHWMPFRPLQVWAGRHGFTDARALWYHIAKYGTKPNNYAGRSIDKTSARLQEFVNRAAREAGLA